VSPGHGGGQGWAQGGARIHQVVRIHQSERIDQIDEFLPLPAPPSLTRKSNTHALASLEEEGEEEEGEEEEEEED